MAECVLQINNNLNNVLELSGKFFYQMGQYYDCLANEQLRYNLVTFKVPNTNIDLGTSIGLCLPKSCQKSLISATIDALLQQMKIPFEVSSINNNVQGYHYEVNFAFYLTVIIAVVTLGLVIISSLKPKLKSISMFNIKESRKIFKLNPDSDLNVLNGIRSISMIWVVFGHTMSYSISGSVNISSSIEKNSLLKPFFLIVEAGLFAVDIFFYVGGILLAYVFLRQANQSRAKYPLALVQRLLRFWPSYLFAMLIYYSVYLHLGDGPRWGVDQYQVKWCQNMWKPLLFVDNLVDNGETQCMGWGWYLQNDMQLFLVSLILLFVYSIKPIVSKILIGLLSLGAIIFTYVWTYDHEVYVISHLNDFSTWGDYMLNVYMKPWARAPPYMIGLFLGIIYYEYLEERKMIQRSIKTHEQGDQKPRTILGRVKKVLEKGKTARIVCETLGVFIMLFLILIPRTLQTQNPWPQTAHSLYQCLAKVVFVIGLSLAILPSLLGSKQSLVRFSMDTKEFNFIAKISFCTYLIHLTILQIWIQSRTTNRYYTIIPPLVQFCGILIISLFLGLVMTFMIQIPFSKLQKKLIGTLRNLAVAKNKNAKASSQSTIQSSSNQIKESLISNE